MPSEQQPDDPQIPRIKKIITDYPDGFWTAVRQEYDRIARVRKILNYTDSISAIKASPSGPPPAASGPEAKDSLDALSEKLAAINQRINSEIKKENVVFQSIRKEIESELDRVPLRHSPGRPATPAETEPVPGPAPALRPARTPSVPVKDRPSPLPPAPSPASTGKLPAGAEAVPPPAAGGGVAIHLLSAGKQAAAPQPGTAFSPRRLWYALALVFLAAAGAGLWRHNSFSAAAHKVFPLSYAQTAGLAVKGPLLFSADPQRQLLFTLAREDARVKAVQKFPNRSLSGLAAGADCLWSADRDRIYQHNLDTEYSVRRSFANPSQAPEAVYWHDGFLWVGDSRTSTVSKYAAGESLSLAKQYALPGVIPGGFYISGNLLWILDTASNRITRYLLGTTLNPADSLDLGLWTAAGSRTTGFTADASVLFLVTENPAELHSIDLENLKSPAFRKGAW